MSFSKPSTNRPNTAGGGTIPIGTPSPTNSNYVWNGAGYSLKPGAIDRNIGPPPKATTDTSSKSVKPNTPEKPKPTPAEQGKGLAPPPPQQKTKTKDYGTTKDFGVNTANPGSGFGGGRITFNKQGDTLVDNKIETTPTGQPVFSSVRSEDVFLAERGFADTGQLVNPKLSAKSDFSQAPELQPNQNGYYQQALFTEQVKNIKQNAKDSTISDILISSPKPTDSTMIYRNASAEETVKENEAMRASKIYPNYENSDYAIGGTKISDSFGVKTNQSKNIGSVFSWASRGDQLTRGSKQEESVQASEALRASKIYGNYENSDYAIGGTKPTFKLPPDLIGKSYGWDSPFVQGRIPQPQLRRNLDVEKSLLVSEANRGLQTEEKQNVSFSSFNTAKSTQTIKSNPVQIKEPNNNSEQGTQSFEGYILTNAKKGATINIVLNKKIIESIKGPYALTEIRAYEKAHPDQDFSVFANYPEREQALTEAVQKNPNLFVTQPQNYWENLSKTGYLSTSNVNKIQTTLYLESERQNRESLAQTNILFEEIHGGIINGKVVGPQENEVSSFLKVPFAGQKTSTSFIPSTSYSNVLQFSPGLGNGLLGLATKGLEKGIGKAAPEIYKVGEGIKNKIGQSAANKVIYESPLLNTPKLGKLPVSNEIIVRNRPTYRSTNMMRERVPSDVFSSDKAEGKSTISARLNTPRSTSFENTSQETQKNLTEQQNNLLKNANEKPNPPSSTNIPFFSGRISSTGRPYTSNIPAINIRNLFSNEVANVQVKSSSVAPIQTITKDNTGISPISRQNFGSQFIGIYPTEYLPPESSVYKPGFAKPVEIDQFYQNILPYSRLGSNKESDFLSTIPKKEVNYDILFGNSDITSPTFSERIINLGERTSTKRVREYNLQKTMNDLLETSKPKEKKLTSEEVYYNIGKGIDQNTFLRNSLKNYPDYMNKRGSASISSRPKEYVLDFNAGKQEFPKRPLQPYDLIPKGGFGGKLGYSGKSPLSEKFGSSSKYSQPVVNVREFLGLEGEKVYGKSSGLLPLEKYVFVYQQGAREGEIVSINRETGAYKRVFYSKPEVTGRTGPKDISTFGNNNGEKYYKNESIYDMGNKFPRGSLQNKDVGLIRFEKYQEKNPEPQQIGPTGIWKGLEKSLSKNNTKSPVFSTTSKEPKSTISFRSSSAKLFEQPKEKKEGSSEVKNTGAKSETILVRKPLTRKKLTSSTTLYDYDYKYLDIPPNKEGKFTSYSIKNDNIKGFKLGSILSPIHKTGIKINGILKTPQGLKSKSNNILSPKQTPRQNIRLTPYLTSKITPKMIIAPKQTPRQKVQSKFKFPTPLSTKLITVPPPRVPAPKLNWPLFGKSKKPKTNEGPTAVIRLDVNNAFVSDLSIIGKREYHFNGIFKRK